MRDQSSMARPPRFGAQGGLIAPKLRAMPSVTHLSLAASQADRLMVAGCALESSRPAAATVSVSAA